MEIKKVVIPAAGMGTRFLPFTKSAPKELLPLLGMPSIHYIMQECCDAGINHACIIVNETKSKQAIKHYFSHDEVLQNVLEKSGKADRIARVNSTIACMNFSYVNQDEPRGLGHAVLMAREIIDDEYFGIALPDDIVVADTPAMKQLLNVAQAENASVIAVREVPHEKTKSYGVIAPKGEIINGVVEIADLVEKPDPKDAPSNLAIVGRYILSPKIFDSLATIPPGSGGEIQLTDGIRHMMQTKGEKIFACVIQGNRYDVGNPRGHLLASIDLAKQLPEYADDVIKACAPE